MTALLAPLLPTPTARAKVKLSLDNVGNKLDDAAATAASSKASSNLSKVEEDNMTYSTFGADGPSVDLSGGDGTNKFGGGEEVVNKQVLPTPAAADTLLEMNKLDERSSGRGRIAQLIGGIAVKVHFHCLQIYS